MNEDKKRKKEEACTHTPLLDPGEDPHHFFLSKLRNCSVSATTQVVATVGHVPCLVLWLGTQQSGSKFGPS